MALYGRFDCSMPRDRRMIAVGWQGRAVYFEATLYCRENLTDGLIERVALAQWMVDNGEALELLNDPDAVLLAAAYAKRRGLAVGDRRRFATPTDVPPIAV